MEKLGVCRCASAGKLANHDAGVDGQGRIVTRTISRRRTSFFSESLNRVQIEFSNLVRECRDRENKVNKIRGPGRTAKIYWVTDTEGTSFRRAAETNPATSYNRNTPQ
jgi:hypothetical protein